MQPDRRDHPEQQQRQNRSLVETDRDQADEEDEHAREPGEPGLEQHRGQHERRVTDAEPPQRRNPCGRDPDRPRHVLREDRRHLGLERDQVRNLEPPGGEHPLPGDREQEVVGGEDHHRDEDIAEVGLAEQRLRLVPGVAERPVEEGEEDDERRDLNRDDHPTVGLQPLACPLDSPHQQSVTNSVEAAAPGQPLRRLTGGAPDHVEGPAMSGTRAREGVRRQRVRS